jgi:hypothetical protein
MLTRAKASVSMVKIITRERSEHRNFTFLILHFALISTDSIDCHDPTCDG